MSKKIANFINPLIPRNSHPRPSPEGLLGLSRVGCQTCPLLPHPLSLSLTHTHTWFVHGCGLPTSLVVASGHRSTHPKEGQNLTKSRSLVCVVCFTRGCGGGGSLGGSVTPKPWPPPPSPPSSPTPSLTADPLFPPSPPSLHLPLPSPSP